MIAEVLQIKEQMLGDYSVQAVDGEALHEALGIKGRFRDWMPSKLVEAGAILGTDYTKEVRENNRGPASLVYTLTLSLAKDVAMLSRGRAAQSVRDYFKSCEKAVHELVPQLTASDSVVSQFVKQVKYVKEMAELLSIDNGKVQKYYIEEGTRIEQETGVKVLVPQLLQDAGLQIDFDSPDGTLAHAAEVGVGTVFTNASKWGADMYGSKAYSTLINNTLIELGYAVRMNNLKIAATVLGSQFSNAAPIAHSGHNNLTNTPTVYGWNLDDRRFTDVVFPVIAHKISIGKKR